MKQNEEMSECGSPLASPYCEGQIVVLWDLDEQPIVPCGFVIEYPDHVRVRIVGDGWGLRERWDQPLYGELKPDATRAVFNPGDPGYFDRVCGALFRTFALSKLPQQVKA